MKVRLYYDQELNEVSNMTDPSEICELIQTKINRYLEEQAPMRKIQISSKLPKFSTQTTRDLINNRDEALDKAKVTDMEDDWRLYRNLKNCVLKALNIDKK